MLCRLLAILRHEGVMGLYDRIRYPKPFWKQPTVPSALQGQVRIRGGNADEKQQVKQALREAGIAVVPDNTSDAATTIFLGPSFPEIAQVTDKDILAGTLCTDMARMAALVRQCRVALIPSLSGIVGLTERGISLEKVFFLKGQEHLHESMTRCLLALQNGTGGGVDWRHFSDLRDLPQRPRICVGLPETVERRQNFMSRRPKHFIIFDGIRRNPGWIGTGESFRVMAQACLAQDVDYALLAEDDVQVPPDFEDRLVGIQDYLNGCNWDIFSGLITDIGPDYAVTKVVRHGDQTFVHLNRCVGMVFGMYRKNALLRLAAWDAATGLTIDRFLEKADNLRVVTTLPFLAGHDDVLTSSIWRFSNRRYSRMIRASEERLRLMVQAHGK